MHLLSGCTWMRMLKPREFLATLWKVGAMNNHLYLYRVIEPQNVKYKRINSPIKFYPSAGHIVAEEFQGFVVSEPDMFARLDACKLKRPRDNISVSCC
jgi:hypothetical protein